MEPPAARGRSENVQWIQAPPEAVYRAFMDPDALTRWLAPDGMTGQVHAFDGRVGGGYEMSLFYAPDAENVQGKTADLEDRFTARFLELDPPRRIVQAIDFRSPDPAFQGEMRMTVTLTGREGGTEVRMVFHDIPPGVRPEDNEAGTASSLGKLARLLEGSGDR